MITTMLDRHRLHRLFASALLAVLVSCGNPGISDHLERAKKFQTDHDFKSAIIEYRNAVALDPNSADARWALAQVLLKVGDGAAAEKEIDAAIRSGLKVEQAVYAKARAMLIRQEASAAETYLSQHKPVPLTVPYLITMGDINAVLARLSDATANYQEAVKLDPKSSDGLLGLARIALTEGKAEAAEKLAKQAADLEDGNFETPVVRGNISYAQGRYAESVEHFKAAIKQAPYLLISKLGVIQALLASGRGEEAGPYIDQAVQQAPKSPIVATYKAYLLSQSDDPTSAIDLCRTILSTYPDMSQAQLLLGGLLMRTGSFENAAELLTAYHNDNPGNLLGRKLLAMVQLSLRQPENAIVTMTTGLDPQSIVDPQLLVALGSAYAQTNRPELAQPLLDRAASLSPEDVNIAIRAKVLELLSGDSEKALAALHAIVSSTPDFAPSQRVLIAYHLGRREFDKALAIADDAVKNSPQDPVIRNLRATALLAKGDKVGARAGLEKALELKPDDLSANLDLASLDMLDGKLAESQARLESLSKTGPPSPPTMAMLAKIHTDQGQPQAATPLLEECLKLAPRDLGCRVELARNYLALGRIDDAERATDAALKIDSSDASLTLLAGDIAMLKRSPETARNSYAALSKANPGSVAVLLRLAKAENQLGKLDEADAAIKRIFSASPDSVEALALLAVVELKRGNESAARAAIEKCLPLEKAAGACHELSGDLAARHGDFATALSLYDKAAVNFKSFDLLTKQVNLLRILNNPVEAAARLDKWSVDDPNDLRPLLFQAAAAKEEGKLDDARAHYEKALSIQKNNPVALNNLAMLYLDAGDVRGFDLAKRAFDALPDNDIIADTYGWALLKAGQTEQGAKLIARSVAKAPHNPSFQYHHAVATLARGDSKTARESLERALKVKVFPERQSAEKLLATLR